MNAWLAGDGNLIFLTSAEQNSTHKVKNLTMLKIKGQGNLREPLISDFLGPLMHPPDLSINPTAQHWENRSVKMKHREITKHSFFLSPQRKNHHIRCLELRQDQSSEHICGRPYFLSVMIQSLITVPSFLLDSLRHLTMLKNCMYVKLSYVKYSCERLTFLQNHKLTLNINFSKTQKPWILV